MKESTRNLLVGIFVVASLAVLGWLMMWFGEAPSLLGGSQWTLRITGVQELSGIGEGSPVNLNGVEIGRVQKLEFEDPVRPGQGVVIVAAIKNTYSVPAGATARVYGATLGFGTGHVAIVVEPSLRAVPLVRGFAQIPGEMRSIIGEVISKEMLSSLEGTVNDIGELAAAAIPVAENLAKLLEKRTIAETTLPGAAEKGITPNFSTVIERLESLVAHADAILGDESVRDDIKEAAGDLRQATEELKQTIGLWKTEGQRISDNVNTGIDRTEENLDQSFAKLNQVLDNLDDATKSMAATLHRVREGEGTAGLFARDDRLYEAAVLTFERFSELIGTLQRITGKIEEDGYITLAKPTPVGTIPKRFPVGPATLPE